MTGLEKLREFQNAKTIVDSVEDELYHMVDPFFKDCQGTWYFESLNFSEETCELHVEEVIMGEGEYYNFPVPTHIITKYLDGDKEEAAKEFQLWHKEYWAIKKREEEEKQRLEREAEAKAQEQRDYDTFLKLKERFEGNK